MAKKKEIDKNVYESARERVFRAYELFDHIAVSFSGGKDSTAVLNVAIEVARELDRLPLDVIFYDEEAIPIQTDEYVRRVSKLPEVNLRWYCLPIKHRNACSRKHPWWHPWNPEKKDKWVRPLPEEAITMVPGFKPRYSHSDVAGLLFDPKKHGNVGMLMGIRAQESMTRYRAVTGKKIDNYIIRYEPPTDRGNLWKVYPIYDWTTEDVWTAPDKFGWDYNTTYDALDKAGVSPYMQRCSPPYGEEPLQKLWTYKKCFPEIWDRMSTRVPGANTAVRYALTDLYAYGGTPDKPDGMTWEEFLTYYIKKFNPKDQKRIAKRIQGIINRHYKKTMDPIMPTAPHPETGVCWKLLLRIANRGDFKNRTQPGMNLDTRKLDKHWEKYNEELAEYRKGDR